MKRTKTAPGRKWRTCVSLFLILGLLLTHLLSFTLAAEAAEGLSETEDPSVVSDLDPEASGQKEPAEPAQDGSESQELEDPESSAGPDTSAEESDEQKDSPEPPEEPAVEPEPEPEREPEESAAETEAEESAEEVEPEDIDELVYHESGVQAELYGIFALSAAAERPELSFSVRDEAGEAIEPTQGLLPGQTEQEAEYYANAARIQMTVTGCTPGRSYLAAVTKGQQLIQEQIYYINQIEAQGESVTFDLFPRQMEVGDYSIFLVAGGEAEGLNQTIPVAGYSFYRTENILTGQYQGHTYELRLQAKTWAEAKELCESRGGHLAVITSQEENDFLAGLMPENCVCWIGAGDQEQEGSFVWVTGEPFQFTNWVQGAPDDRDGTENAIGMDKSGLWNDSTEDSRFAFLCEYELLHRDISGCTITLSGTTFFYDGTEQKPAVTVTMDDKTLTEGVDYELAYQDNVEVGTAKVIVSGKGSYGGSVEQSFYISTRLGDLTDDNVITIADVVKLNRHVISRIQLAGTQLLAADVTGDGVVTIADVVRLNRFLLGRITSLKPEKSGDQVIATAAETVISIGKVTASPGDEIDVPVSIAENPGIAGLAFEFDLPEGVELLSISAGDVLETGTFSVYGTVVTWYAPENTRKNGTLMTLHLKTPTRVAAYSISGKLREEETSNLSDENGDTVTSSFEDGQITVTQTKCKHIWDNGKITKAATTTEEGEKTFTCTVCHQTRTEVVQKLKRPEQEPKPAPAKKSNTITASNIVKSYSTKAQSFNLNASANGAPLTYTSNDKKKVQVKANGKVTIKKKFAGTVTITITASETDTYKSATKTVTVTVPTVTNVKKTTVDKGKMTIQWKKNKTGNAYEVQYSADKKFKDKKKTKSMKVKKQKTVKSIIKLKKGTYYVRIRTLNGKCTSNWSKAKTVEVK